MVKVLEVNVDDLHSGGVFSFVKNLITCKQADIDMDIAAIEKFQNKVNVDFLEADGCKVYYVGYEGSKWKKQLICYKNLKKLLGDGDYTVVHIHADTANKLLVSGLAAKKAGINQIILHSHSSGIDGNHRGLKNLIHKICKIFLKDIGTKFVACSDVAAKWMFSDVKELTIINNGIDLEKFRFNPEDRTVMRQKMGITDEILIGHVGRFAYQKNHEYILQIIRALVDGGNKIKLLLIGEGPRENEIRELAKKLHIQNQIIFYGISDEVNKMLQAMDVFILPSHFEGLPIVGVEAQAAGLPVIYSNKITAEAKLRENVEYIPINEESIALWVAEILSLSEKANNRESAIGELKERGFDIWDTASIVSNLYKEA